MSGDEFVITQPAGTRTLALRESYLAICEKDKCQAHLLNANERWYVWKLKERKQARHRNKAAEAGGEIPEADESLWVFNSAGEWVEELLGTYDEKTVRKALEKLVERGFLARRSNPKRKWDRKPQWLFLRSNVQAAVDAWAATRPQPDINPSAADEHDAAGEGEENPGEGNAGTSEENPGQDNTGESDTSTRENSRMQSGETANALGNNGESIREKGRGNTTGILPRDPSQESSSGKKEVGELPGGEGDTGAGRYDEGQEEEQDFPADVEGEGQAHTPVTGHGDDLEGGNGEGQATDTEQVPGARDEIHMGVWDPADVNARLDQLFNKRWLTGYRIKGTGPVQPALVTEMDGTGVDRRDLARLISPEKLEDLLQEARQTRARQTTEARANPHAKVLTVQHLLIQAMEAYALRVVELQASIEAFRADAETDEEPRPLDDDGQTPGPAALTLQRPRQRREWQVGDVVSYRRDQYTVISVTDRKIVLDSDVAGGVDIIRSTTEVDALRLIQAAPAPAEASA